MKRAIVITAIVVAVLGVVVAVLVWQESNQRAKSRKRALEFTRTEARELVGYCDLGGFATQIEEGTSHFGLYIATDRARAAKTLDEVVMPVIAAREVACSSAKSDLELLKQDGEPDAWVDRQLPVIAANRATIAATRAAAQAFKAGLADPATSGDELVHRASAIRAAARPR